VREFLAKESASGFVLMGAALLGLLWANSPFHGAYESVLHASLGTPAFFSSKMTLHHWVNDGLMAIFFLLVGMEIKREVLAGELSSPSRAALPAIAAAGGVIVPALVCLAFVYGDPARRTGWAIPAATDIAFALAVLALVGKAVPPALKVFLTALAVIDDLVAIVIIAVFYTADVAGSALLASAGCLAVLVAFNRLRVRAIAPYVVVGTIMWFFVLESGVHATLAGVALAFTIPMSALRKFEHALHPYVAFLIPAVRAVQCGRFVRGRDARGRGERVAARRCRRFVRR